MVVRSRLGEICGRTLWVRGNRGLRRGSDRADSCPCLHLTFSECSSHPIHFMHWVSEKGFHHVESEKLYRHQMTHRVQWPPLTDKPSPQEITFPGAYKPFLVKPGQNPTALTPVQALSTIPTLCHFEVLFPKSSLLEENVSFKGPALCSSCGAFWAFLTSSPQRT